MESLLALNVRNARLLPAWVRVRHSQCYYYHRKLSLRKCCVLTRRNNRQQASRLVKKIPFRPSSPKLNLVIPEIRECVINCLEARAEIRMQWSSQSIPGVIRFVMIFVPVLLYDLGQSRRQAGEPGSSSDTDTNKLGNWFLSLITCPRYPHYTAHTHKCLQHTPLCPCVSYFVSVLWIHSKRSGPLSRQTLFPHLSVCTLREVIMPAYCST